MDRFILKDKGPFVFESWMVNFHRMLFTAKLVLLCCEKGITKLNTGRYSSSQYGIQEGIPKHQSRIQVHI